MLAYVVVVLTVLDVCVPLYHHQFAVFVPGGPERAHDLAHRHGFINHGEIGNLKHYFLLSHPHVSKRSPNASLSHFHTLKNDPQVRWVMQQRELRRSKRDHQSRPRHVMRQSSAPAFPDPLFKEQWYLNGGAADGLDMNVGYAWRKGYTGKGVVITILDDGIQPNHPDLSQNYDPAASTDINGNDTDPTPQDNGDNKHGTRCAGEVAAVAYNRYCGVGIAYNASIGGVRMLDGLVNDAVEAQALGFNTHHIDIYSASWGPEDDGKTVDGPGPLARRAFINGVTNGRGGKGSIFIWASGNGGRHTDSCNCDGYANSIFTISISSATQGGYKPWYLEECSSTIASTYSSGTPGRDKSVATVDMDVQLRPDHICTVDHTGTSASAPLAAGICALALEANPLLTWRDMQHLVVMTSRSQPLEKEEGWIVNGVKRKVSHKFGYGLMDAAQMVTLAEQWTNVPPQHICKSQEINEDKSIETSFGYTISVHMDVNGCSGTMNEVRFLEHVQCKISLSFFPRGNLRILLTSPMGTTSTLLFERTHDATSSNFDDWPFLSVHFWGESAEGRWTLQILNAGNIHVTQPGILKKWQLIFYGTATSPIRLRNKSYFNSNNVYQEEKAYHINDVYDASEYSQFLNEIELGISDRRNYPKNIPSAQRKNVLADANDKQVQRLCDPECDSQGCYGKGPTQCVACKHYRLDNTCVSRCPPRSFVNQGGVCWPCHESCETCAGAGQDSCLTCAPAHLLVVDLAVCLQQCPDGYYEDPDANACFPCAEHCDTCSEKADMCSSCAHNYVLYNGSCLAACPPGTHQKDDFGCMPCHETCESCHGPSENACVSCRIGDYAFKNRCVPKCPPGYYADAQRRECLPCPIGCSICTCAVCSVCQEKWSLTKSGTCLPNGNDKCDTSEYYEGGRCKNCHSTCEKCSGSNEWDCLSCSSPLLLQGSRCVAECGQGSYQTAGRCSPCPHTCKSCVSRLNCTMCAGALRLQSGTCRATCAPGYYPDEGTCSKCYLSCETCTGPRRDQCASCPPDWRLAAGECRPECPQNFFPWQDSCRRCHHYCQDCHGAGPQRCTSCPPHFSLENGLCVECLSSQYYEPRSRTCRPCHDSCRSCSGPGPTSCVTCAHPLRLDRVNHKCLPCCTESMVSLFVNSNQTDCCHCDKDIGGCLNGSSAGKRRIAENIRTHITASFFIEDSKDATNLLERNSVVVWSVAAVLLGTVVIIIAVKIKSRKYKYRTIYPKTEYSQLTTIDEDLIALTSSTTLKAVDSAQIQTKSELEEPT
nr:furin-like protease 2 [Helicoverpa armigera]